MDPNLDQIRSFEDIKLKGDKISYHLKNILEDFYPYLPLDSRHKIAESKLRRYLGYYLNGYHRKTFTMPQKTQVML